MTKDDADKEKFIIALRKDNSIAWGEIDPIIIRNTGAEFAKSWADGLAQITDQFEKDSISRNTTGSFELTKKWWDSVFSSKRSIVDAPENYTSNWFAIKQLPEAMNVFKIVANKPIEGDIVKNANPPVRKYKNRLITFASRDEVMAFLKEFDGHIIDNPFTLPIDDIIGETFKSMFIRSKEARKILIELLNKSLDLFLGDYRDEKI